MSEGTELGVVVGGSLTKSIEIRLDPGRSASLGQYVMAPLDGDRVILGMITDVMLKAAEAGATSWPPPTGDDPTSTLLREVLLDTGVYTAAEVSPYLEMDQAAGQTSRARSLPRHFARVSLATQEALNSAFETNNKPALTIGTPLGMDDVSVWVDIERLFERSAGIFGKSGTGKTVTALQLLDAMVAHSGQQRTNKDKTVALVFDMHDDYGRTLKFEGGDGSRERKSLKQRHPTEVNVFHLEANAVSSDGRVVIGTKDIEPEDLEVLQSVGYFTGPAIEAAHECHSRFGKGWIDAIVADDPGAEVVRKGWADGDEPEDVNWAKVSSRLGFHAGSFDNLRRGLKRFLRRDFVQGGSAQFDGTINRLVQLLQGGKSVVIQFGSFGNDVTSYMLVANMLSRRIWDRYKEDVEGAHGRRGQEPNRLVIVIEEAHKFIDKSMAGQSVFGQIARELRKYNVTLLVIDQRPSQIDSEVLSQIGTKFCLQLDSEADIDAVIGGMVGRAGLRAVIASLESQQQALVFGHALPMPVVVRPPDLTNDATPGATLRQRLGAPPLRAATPEGLFG